jgi:hypothetical protein
MNQIQANKYSIAWFKLAECVSRRERERALGVYRLLAHSFDNPALACQLEADIILAFNEPGSAISKYLQAAQLYEKQGELMQAIAVYDHIIMLQDSAQLFIKMIESAARMQDTKSISVYIKRLCHYLIQKGDIGQLIMLIQESDIEFNLQAAFLIETIGIIVEDKNIERQIKLRLINQSVQFLMQDDQVLKLLLLTLKNLDNDAYEYACACLGQ